MTIHPVQHGIRSHEGRRSAGGLLWLLPILCVTAPAILTGSSPWFLPRAGMAADADGRVNLALKKPATASSIENAEQAADKANDGDEDTRWCADDEPEHGAEWWQVDLEKPADLSGGQICWPYEGKRYRYKVEGSADKEAWAMLSDQTKTTARARVQDLKFENAKGMRYVRVTVTGFDEGCWASISEVRIYGVEQSTGGQR